jgi:hypothetical protein
MTVKHDKSEIRISKSETNPNDQNSNAQNEKNLNASFHTVLNFEHLDFEFVSYFVLRASDLNFCKSLMGNMTLKHTGDGFAAVFAVVFVHTYNTNCIAHPFN